MNRRIAFVPLLFAACLLAGCAGPREHAALQAPLDALLPATVLLVGEQHDAPDHQRIQHELIDTLAARGALAAVALEMAEAGRTTASLPRRADEAAVQAALAWNDAAWPWQRYRAVVMAAVRAGVPVLGANLPRAGMRGAMADASLDTRLSPPALSAQQQAIREGHCGLLPDAQIAPMTRIQVARDVRMAQVADGARIAGKTVVVVAGAGHVLRERGIPVHLPDTVNAKVLVLAAGDAAVTGADHVLRTPALPPTDYCATLRERMQPRK